MQPLSGSPGYHTRKNETGNRYGRLVVVGTTLRRGVQFSCGCLRDELAAELCNKRWDEYRDRLIRAFFTTGLYRIGPPKGASK